MDLGYVPLGRTGLQVSELAFGTWRFGRRTDQDSIEIPEERAYELLDAYEAAGGRFIDTADVYGDGDSERWIGNWLTQKYTGRHERITPISQDSHGPTSAGRSMRSLIGSVQTTSMFCTSTAGTTPRRPSS
jgi:diketogulonate reductase-like aldo/keto reductase